MLEKLEYEYKDALAQLAQYNDNGFTKRFVKGFPEVRWFLEETGRFFSKEHLENAEPELIVLGEDFPQEIALAFTPDAWFVLGGSLETTHWSDAMLPRDADPVSRSACGWLLNDSLKLRENSLVVMSLSSDSRRKLAGMLVHNGIQVAPVDIPPMFLPEESRNAWVSEMLQVIEVMEKHTGVRLTARRLNKAIRQKRRIWRAVRDFKEILRLYPNAMHSALRDFVLESVWYCLDKNEWVRHLSLLTRQIHSMFSYSPVSAGTQFRGQRLENHPGYMPPSEDTQSWGQRSENHPGYMPLSEDTQFWGQRSENHPGYIPPSADTRPWVLIAGSPVIFPNTKLPVLVEEAGLYLADRADSVAVQSEIPCYTTGTTVKNCLHHIAARRFPRETSGAFVCNSGLHRAVRSRIEDLPIDGIIYHVLKGQVEYDFELPRIEKLAKEYDLPLIRLETDYQKQDIEQLRIRLEAFSEMLHQRKAKEEPFVS